MTSSDNVENKQDKCLESDNVHYDYWYGSVAHPIIEQYADFADAYVDVDLRTEIDNQPIDPVGVPAQLGYYTYRSNPHATPISTPQVNHTPSRGIQDDDC